MAECECKGSACFDSVGCLLLRGRGVGEVNPDAVIGGWAMPRLGGAAEKRHSKSIIGVLYLSVMYFDPVCAKFTKSLCIMLRTIKITYKTRSYDDRAHY